ncbi:MAG: tatC [Microbacteriaceae bacterium]|nr:tatC [Microbacteriaceae bacterium]
MSLGQHLVEMRKRLIISGLAITLGTIGGFIVAEEVWEYLRQPILALAASQNASINYTSITEAFDLRVQIAFVLGILGTSPIWLYQIWAFVVPALVRKEKRYALGFFFSAVPLFLAGAYLGWIIFPRTVTLMLGFASNEDATFLTARYFLDFVIKLVLAIGIAFVLPVFLVLFNFIGILSAKAILAGWRIAVLLIVIFTALATPAADILAMVFLSVPMVVLYFAAAGVAWLHDKSVARRLASYDVPATGAGNTDQKPVG